MTNTKVIEIENVSYSYDNTPALQNVTMSIEKGDFVGIIGPNGGGKTTLLKLILALIKPDSGTIKLLGDSPQKTRSLAGYIPQETNLNKTFPISVRDVILMGLVSKRGIGHHYTKGDKDKACQIIDKLNISKVKDRCIKELSGGQRQKVLLARALISEPEIIFLDEPTASIDSSGTDEIYDILRDLNKNGTTIIIVTHNIGILSKYIKSVACVNKELYFHSDKELDSNVITTTFGCPVDLIAHGVPHRVFEEHEHKK